MSAKNPLQTMQRIFSLAILTGVAYYIILSIYFVIIYNFMKTALLTVKIDPKVKRKAHAVAEALGMSLGTLVSVQLNEFIRTKTVHASLSEDRPTPYLLKALKESAADVKAGRVSPQFDNATDAIKWLTSRKKSYSSAS
ncbi:MAG: hypothetical protein UX10_C0030G0006 [Candidatus Magasanikbacteria bacterium GW2011_GWA2_45_39]|uniref:Addiction module antitoxin, RelB/DinJ family n=1 Tax=Candidatus Magasanikbacteria bacterium GW2011_GWA2_45_39 TaxID=1619041 RepID=A0A0G1QCX5_9BACT|nr:MAG: hypothetical protein UX10_C0030G0006 [Candidatus Magasanikbacteria bacterium GW2011_GWA2_45_39]